MSEQTNDKSLSEPSIDDLLSICALWGNPWEGWSQEEKEHYIANFKNSPNFKEAKAAIITALDQLRYPHIEGNCPMGCGSTLFIANGGYITCSFTTCPDPSRAADLLADRETEHIVKFTDDGFTVQHPLREHHEELMNCDLHVKLANLDTPPVKPGMYRFIAQFGNKPWRFETIKTTAFGLQSGEVGLNGN